jgi:hypothetical protein
MFNGDFFCIETYSGIRGIARDPKGKQFLLPPIADAATLGTAVIDALAASRILTLDEVPDFFDYELGQKRYAEWVKGLMERYGYKTRRNLFKNMQSCHIDCVEGQIIIRPTNHEKLEGWSGDGISKEDYVAVLLHDPPDAIGLALRKAFDRCI